MKPPPRPDMMACEGCIGVKVSGLFGNYTVERCVHELLYGLDGGRVGEWRVEGREVL